jgi:hypothetical protein
MEEARARLRAMAEVEEKLAAADASQQEAQGRIAGLEAEVRQLTNRQGSSLGWGGPFSANREGK